MIVADASVIYEALLHEGPCEERVTGVDVCAPHLLDVEVTSALRTRLRQGAIALPLAKAALDDLAEMDILRYDHSNLIERAWALRDNVSPYDGVYIALAEWLDVPLVTTDARLAAAPGIKATVEVLPVS